MTKSLPIIVTLLLVLIIISAGCIRSPSSTNTTGNNQQSSQQSSMFGTGKTTNQNSGSTIQTTVPTPTPKIVPNFAVGQIALSGSGGSSGLAIVDYNNATSMYGTLPVTKDSKGTSWHTDGYQIIEWKSVTVVDRDNKFALSFIVNPADIPEYDPTQEKNVFFSQPCDLVGDWRVNNGVDFHIQI